MKAFKGWYIDLNWACGHEVAEREERRMAVEKDRLAECTFTPKINKREPLGPAAQDAFVERAITFHKALLRRPKLLGQEVRQARLTPFYDDCWANRGRCPGHPWLGSQRIA